MDLNTFYISQFDAAKKLLDLLELSINLTPKQLNVEDVDWQLGVEGPLDPFILSFGYSIDDAVDVYPKIYIGLAVDHDLAYMRLIYRYAKTLNLRPILYGRIDLSSSKWVKFFEVVDIGLVSVDDIQPLHNIMGLKFSVSGGKVIVARHVDSLGILLYLIRPLSALMASSPYLTFPIRISDKPNMDDGIYLLDKSLNPVDKVEDVYYGCISIDGTIYIEDLRLITIPRNKT